MKPDIKVETIRLTCPCGYAGMIEYEKIIRCPRCKDHWTISVRFNVVSIEIFDEWVSRIVKKAQEEFNLLVGTSLVEEQLRRIVDVEELMWNQHYVEWELSKWMTCMGATMKWIKREMVDKK